MNSRQIITLVFVGLPIASLLVSPLVWAQEEIRIGVLYPLTGALAPTGKLSREGVELAVELVNGAYSLNLPLAKSKGLPRFKGAKLKVIFADTQGSPEIGLAEAERLITQEKVVALLGAYQSAVTATASQAAERLKVPFLNPDSTSPTLIRRNFKWFFRITPDDEMFAENFFQFLKDLEKKGIKVRTLSLAYENTLWGRDVGTFEKRLAAKYGYKVVQDIPYPAKTVDVTSEVQRLKLASADVVMMASYISDAILYTKTMKQLDFTPKAILAMDAGHTDPAYLQTVGKDGNYILSREVWALDLSRRKPLVKQVNDLFRARYGHDMDGTSARAFTGLLVLADAINRAGSTAPEAIRQALLATDIPPDQLIMPWAGIRFDPANGQNTKGKGIIVQIQEGVYHTVWPWELASKPIIWPMPTWRERK